MLLPLHLNGLNLDSATAVAVVTGTSSAGLTELQNVTGGETTVATLTNDTWVASGATFNAQRQNILNGATSAQSELLGWNAEVRDKEVVTAVVRTSDTVVTITWSAAPAYDVTSDETITVTIPATALTGATELIASPTIGVTADVIIPASTAVSGGWIMRGVFDDFSQRKRQKIEKAEQAIENALELEGIDGEIAKILHENDRDEVLEQSIKELEGLIADNFSERELQRAKAHNERVAIAFARAATQKNFSAIQAFERELERANEEEEFLLLALTVLR